MPYIYLGILVLMSIVIWPISRYTMKNGGRAHALGLIISLITVVGGIISALLTHKPILDGQTSLYGVAMGFSYSIGFCMIIFTCLRIGPSGPTTVINNLGAMAPILLSMFIFEKGAVSWVSIVCIAVIFVAMALISGGRADMVSANRKWVILVLLGFVCSSVSFSSQFMASRASADAGLAYLIMGYGVSALVLAAAHIVGRHTRIRKEEWIGGGLIGLMMVFNIPMMLSVLKVLSPSLVFPIIIAVPNIVVLFIGVLFYKEKLGLKGWLGCLAGVAGLVVLNLVAG